MDSSEEASSISFPSTGAWTNWDITGSVEITLTTGIKDIRLKATTGDSLANIDYMQISGSNL